MSAPIPAGTVVVDPAAVAALAAELSALAGERLADAAACRAGAASITAALGGLEGWEASGTATAWAALEELLAERTAALAATMTAAAQASLAADSALAASIEVWPR